MPKRVARKSAAKEEAKRTVIGTLSFRVMGERCGRPVSTSRSGPKWWNGRHARLRGVWRKPCGFKSRLRHQQSLVVSAPLFNTVHAHVLEPELSYLVHAVSLSLTSLR